MPLALLINSELFQASYIAAICVIEMP